MEQTKNHISNPVLFCCLFIILLTSIVYKDVVHFPFVSFDDTIYVSQNEHVSGGLSKESIKWAFSFNRVAYWHPLTWLSHILDCQLFGLSPGLHHLVNVFFHILNSLLLFTLFYKMTRRLWRCTFIAIVFAIHPINVESVAWIAERKNLLSTFFFLLAIWAYLRYVKSENLLSYFFVLILFIAGLLSKPTLVILPFVLILLDYWPLNRFKSSMPPLSTERLARLHFMRPNSPCVIALLILEKIPLLCLSFLSVWVSSYSAANHGIMVSTVEVASALRIQNALLSYMSYLGKLIWPAKLTVFYPYPDYIPLWLTICSLVWLISVTTIVLYWIKKRPFLFTGWFWYTGTMVPFLGLIQAGLWPAMADRWAYLPIIGFLVIIAWGIPDLLARFSLLKKALPVAAVFVIVSLAAVSTVQTAYWKDDIALYKRALEVTRNNDVMHNNLAGALYRKGHILPAFIHFIEALRIAPDLTSAANNLKNVYLNHGQNPVISNFLSNLPKEYQKNADVHYALGNMYKECRLADLAKVHYRQSLHIDPAHKPAAIMLQYLENPLKNDKIDVMVR